MPKPNADAKWVETVGDWIVANGGTEIAITACLDLLRHAVPNAALHPTEKCVHVAEMAQAAKVGDVLRVTEKQIRAGYMVGPKTMAVLGRFLRGNGLTLADGWDGS